MSATGSSSNNSVSLSPRSKSAVRRRQSMSAFDSSDQVELLANAQLDEVNTSSTAPGYYLNPDGEDSDPEPSAHTPMIMDSETRSPQRDGLVPVNKRAYGQVFILAQVVGASLFLLLAVWVFKYLGGIGFSEPRIIFNFHPLFMIIGFILLYSNAILIYRTLRGELKPKLKLLHAVLNGSVIVVSVFGSSAVFYYHNAADIPHFYSLHSWLGIVTWSLFLSQFTAGFVTFLFPGASYNIRQLLMPFHRFIGVATFVLACATCLTGLNEKAIFTFNGAIPNPKYADFPAGGVVTNLVALLLCTYASIVVYLVTKPEFKRNPLPEEQVINLNFDLTSNN